MVQMSIRRTCAEMRFSHRILENPHIDPLEGQTHDTGHTEDITG